MSHRAHTRGHFKYQFPQASGATSGGEARMTYILFLGKACLLYRGSGHYQLDLSINQIPDTYLKLQEGSP